jgi:hypothetical protein
MPDWVPNAFLAATETNLTRNNAGALAMVLALDLIIL